MTERALITSNLPVAVAAPHSSSRPMRKCRFRTRIAGRLLGASIMLSFALLLMAMAWTFGRGCTSVASLPAAATRAVPTHSTVLPTASNAAVFHSVDDVWTKSRTVHGGSMDMEIWVTSSDLAFDYGSTDALRVGTRIVSIDRHLVTPVFLRDMLACQAMVVVGMASQEGAVDAESRRAAARSEWVQYQIHSTGQLRRPLYSLDMGRAHPRTLAVEHNSAATAYQRRLIVLNIVRIDARLLRDADLFRSALRMRLAEIRPSLPIDMITAYPEFALARRH